MNLRDLEAFVAVVETGSIVAAAARLHLTQPGVTRRVQGLEDVLGAELLDRTSKPLAASEAGRRAYPLARRVLRSADELRAAFAGGAPHAGELRLGLSPFVAETGLRGPLDALRAAFPELTIQVASAWSPELVEQVRAGRLDAAGVYLPHEERLPPELHADPVSDDPVAVVAAPGAPFPRRVRLRRLREIPWVTSRDGCGLRSVVRRAHERAGVPLEVAVEATSLDLQLSLVARGVGLGLVPARTLRAHPSRDRVRVLDVPELKAKVAVWLVHRPPAGRLSAPLAHLREALAAAYARPARGARAGPRRPER